MVLWMVLVFAGFLATDHYDGQWARNYGLESGLGYWLDHVGDVLFYGVVVLSIIRGSTEPEARRRGTKGGAGAPAARPSAPAVSSGAAAAAAPPDLTTSPPPEASAAAARGRPPPS